MLVRCGYSARVAESLNGLGWRIWLAGVPAISIPCGFVGGLPVGMQLIGKPLDEMTILRTAHAFERQNDYDKQFAPLGGI